VVPDTQNNKVRIASRPMCEWLQRREAIASSHRCARIATPFEAG
jgi:hypothetical protein